MPRDLPEWMGSSPDAAIPNRVRVRIFERFGGRCQCGCGRKIATAEKWDAEHERAIINGGENRESNLRPYLAEHHKAKTRQDVAIKAKTYAVRKLHLGIKRKSLWPCGRNSRYRKKINGRVEER